MEEPRRALQHVVAVRVGMSEYPATSLFVAKFTDVLRVKKKIAPGGVRSSQLVASIPCVCGFYFSSRHATGIAPA